MKLSKYPFHSLGVVSKGLDISTERLLRGSFIQQESAGIYKYLPLGWSIIRKIQQIIREELEKINCLECALPNLQSTEIWTKSGRYEAYGKEKFFVEDAHSQKGSGFFLAPTAEESSLEMIASLANSYKKLPLSIFQMQNKYRNEMRPRFGLIRCKEFIMKDAYSFCYKKEDQMQSYMDFFNAYVEIFKKMELDVMPVPAETGEIGGDFSHEFVFLSEIGENAVYFNEKICEKVEKLEDFDKIQASFEKKFTNESRCIEVGQVFNLGTLYSEKMDLKFTNEKGEKECYNMGCYGIGVSRLLSVLGSKKFWPRSLSPFDFHLVEIENQKNYNLDFLKDFSILHDDRKKSAGVKFADADLIGIPQRIIIGEKIQYKDMVMETSEDFENIESLADFLNENI